MRIAVKQPLPLIYPSQEIAFSNAIPSVDLTGTHAGTTNGEVSGAITAELKGVTVNANFDFVPHY